MRELRVMVLNAQDLFLFMDKMNHSEKDVMDLTDINWQLMSSSVFSNKPKEKCQILAQTIKEADADIVMMTEVGGQESLSNFARYILRDEYLALSLPSNSERGIDLGYLIKKKRAFQTDIHSYIDFPLPFPARRFSRDVLRLDLKDQGSTSMIFLLVHIKSKLDLKRTDFEGRTRRSLEVKGLIDIYLDLQRRYPKVPILVGGDMNGHAGEKETEEEFKQLYELTDLKDIASLASVPEEERFSYVYFNQAGHRFVQHLDYLFISQKFSHLLSPKGCYFPRYRYLSGPCMPVPERVEQKNLLPSDHYPFVTTLRP